MKILNLNKERVLQSAQEQFSDFIIELDETDLYLENMEQGEVRMDDINYPLYVSTHYVYEDHLVNDNQTRYKIPLIIIYLKKDAYEVMYDSYGKCYVAYENDGKIEFVLYEDWQAYLKPFVHVIEN